MKRCGLWRMVVVFALVTTGLLGLAPSAFAATLEVGPGKPFSTIQSAIDAASAGDTITVSPGVYKETIAVTKPLALIGPNAGVTVGQARSAEATIMPTDAVAPRDAGAGNRITYALIEVQASDVRIDGFFITGDNRDNASGDALYAGGTAEAGSGIWAGGDEPTGTVLYTERTVVSSCVIRDFPAHGVVFSKDKVPFTASWGNEVIHCSITGIRSSFALYSGAWYPGIAVYSEYDMYVRATNNVLDGMRGVMISDVEKEDGLYPAWTPAISDNTITASIWGITYNPQWDFLYSGRPFNIERNHVTMVAPAVGPTRPQVGMILASVYSFVDTPTAPVVRDNVLVGGRFGYYVFAISSETSGGPLTIEGGSVTGAGDGIHMTNSSAWWGGVSDTYMPASHAVVDGVDVSECTQGAVVSDSVNGGVSNTTLRLDLRGTTLIEHNGLGGLADGSRATLHSELVALGNNDEFWREDNGGQVTWTDTALPSVIASPAAGTYPVGTTVKIVPSHPNVGGYPLAFYSLDGAAVTTYSAPIALTEGTHTVEYVARDEWGHASATQTAHYTIVVPPLVTHGERVYGSDRYTCATEISRRTFASADTVVIASGEVFADGLAASGLAGIYDGPILLVRSDTVPSAVTREIARLGANKAVICGGQRTITEKVRSQLAGSGLSVQRIGGADRYITAQMIADEIRRLAGVEPEMLFIARGDVYADALAVSPLAYQNQVPVLLTRSTMLSPSTAGFIARNPGSDVIIAGGKVSVTDGVASRIDALSSGTITRLAGSDRYQVAVNVATWARDHGFAGDANLGIASGEVFPDALSGGAGIGKQQGVIVLARRAVVPAATANYLTDQRGVAENVYVYGGPATIADSTLRQLFGYVGAVP